MDPESGHITVQEVDAAFVPAILPPGLVLRDGARAGGVAAFAAKWPVWVEDLAFVCYCNAARSVASARKLFAAEWEAIAPRAPHPLTGEIVLPECPDIPVQTWYAWRRIHQWDRKATQFVATNYPEISMNNLATVVQGAGEGLKFLIGVAQGDHDDVDSRILKNRIEAAKTLVIGGGVGTFGTRDRVAPTVRAVVADAIDFASLDDRELARVSRTALHRGKTDIDERKR